MTEQVPRETLKRLEALIALALARGRAAIPRFPLVVTDPTNIIQDATSGQSILQVVTDEVILNGSEGTLFLAANDTPIVSIDTAGMFPVAPDVYTLGLTGLPWGALFVGTFPGSGGVPALEADSIHARFAALVGGNTNRAFCFDSTAPALDVSAAAIVLSPAEFVTPVIPLTGVVHAGGCTITLPNQPGATYYFGFSAVTFGGNPVTFTTGVGTSAVITALKAGGYTLVTVCITGSNVVEAG